MSDRVHTPEPGSKSQPRPTKQERKAAAEAAAVRTAENRARRQRWVGAVAGVVLVGLGFAALIVLRDDPDDRSENTAASAASQPASAAPTAAPTPTPAGPTATPPGSTPSAGEPELDLDPRLGQPPTVEAGEGELSELGVTTLIKGTGPEVRRGQTILANYVGVFYGNGEEFDSSWRQGQPAQFEVGVGKVIPGWDQGLVGVPIGSRVRLDIPVDLAYGPNPPQGYPQGPLRFVVDVLAAR
ncbi:FKBP-type peptidyl-prolyl cis-trans isomerase [Plantactinospora sonchi]|uniref:Peptidyl-prolyl cis-trans isomerase n=1 Tax=Plantactinospora sonchi TaxID=1544735 RepID=A0ABU7RZ03_9ACTN